MKTPPRPETETARLRALRALQILDTPPEERFDRYTRLASRLFSVPIALVSLVDQERQWFKSRVGLELTEGPRSTSFCGHAIHGEAPLVVRDTALDDRFHDNPLVTGEPHIRFYAGVPLRGPQGLPMGTLCVIDREPREFDEGDLAALVDLASLVEGELGALQAASTDPLTGLSNRAGFKALAGQVLGLAGGRRRGDVVMVFADVDGFKQVNDTWGHAEGDAALQEVAEVLTRAFRKTDVIGRIGGDEFGVLAGVSDPADAPTLVRRLQDAVAARNAATQKPYALQISVGLVHYDPSAHASVEDLLAEADALMYAAKRSAQGGESPSGG